MKNTLFLLITLLLQSVLLSQFQEPSERQIVDNKVRSYRIIEKSHRDKKSDLHNREMKLVRFNQKGKKIYGYKFNVDIVYTKDSTFYSYDEHGNLIKIVNYYMDAPTGKEQIKLMRSMGFKIDTNITITNFYYNSDNLKIKQETIEYGKLSREVKYTYNSKKCLISERSSYYILPKNNNENIQYEYNDSLDLVFKVIVKPFAEDTIISTYNYDKNKKIIQEFVDGKNENKNVTMQYDTNGNLIERKVVSKDRMYPEGIYKEEFYFYDENNKLIEQKIYFDNKISIWEKYTYNSKGLISEEIWLDEETGNASTRLVFTYTYYND